MTWPGIRRFALRHAPDAGAVYGAKRVSVVDKEEYPRRTGDDREHDPVRPWSIDGSRIGHADATRKFNAEIVSGSSVARSHRSRVDSSTWARCRFEIPHDRQYRS